MRTLLLLAAVTCLVALPAAGAAGQSAERQVYKPGNGVSAPVVVKEVKPKYTVEAKDAKVQGTVLLDCVVETDGSVGEVKVVKALHDDLDKAAVDAARQWQFKPGTKDGKAVRVQIALEMTFSLK
jgi:TonB family protein